MKKLLTLTLCAALLLSLLVGCGTESKKETQPTEPVAQESPEEANVLKIMIIRCWEKRYGNFLKFR